jgi:O-antigen ligase
VVLYAGFSLLCLRFLIAATGAVYPDVWPVLVLCVGCCFLGCWLPQAALFAFTVSVPLLNGLGYVGLAGCPSPLSVVFSAIFLGFSLKEAQKGANELWRGRQDEFGRKKAQEAQREEAQGADPEVTGQGQRAESGGTDSRSCRATEAGEPSVLSDRWTVVTVKRYPTVQLATDVLTTVVLASLVMQIARHHDAAGFWKVCCSQPVFGYGDPLYFITSAFVWLQGLFFFRMLCGEGTAEKFQVSSSKYQDRSAQGGGAVTTWIKPAFVVFGISIAAFYLLQRCFNVPDPYDTSRYCSPFEDIHSFGSIAVALFIYSVATWRWKTWIRAAFRGLWIAGLLALVILSWSRATWLAGALVLLLVAWNRLPKRWTAMLVAMGAIAMVVLNANANRESWNQNIYLHRLITLVRLEKPSSKAPDRLNLYHKAIDMIRERPIAGHGIGSFYLTSVRFSRSGNPNAEVPDFAHNFLLQMATELGVPVAALFLALILFALWQGYRKSGARKKFQVPSPFAEASADRSSKFQDIEAENPEAGGEKWKAESGSRDGRTGRQSNGQDCATLGVTMALVAYLITQMTANALNIYVSNQFFFWFLMAAALCGSDGRKEAQESQILKVE